MPLFKYLAEEAYARELIDKGEIFMRPLSYFRAFEDELVRGDPDDGKLCHAPEYGLVITKSSGEVVEMKGWRFRASVQADDIFVYCLSTELSAKIAAKFECPFCVEISEPVRLLGEPVRLLGRVSSHVRLRSRLDRHVYSHAINYRDRAEAPGIDWALPERVAFIKPDGWAWQKEHRIVVGAKGAFAVKNVDLALETGGGVPMPTTGVADPLVLHIGDLSKVTTLHRL